MDETKVRVREMQEMGLERKIGPDHEGPLCHDICHTAGLNKYLFIE